MNPPARRAQHPGTASASAALQRAARDVSSEADAAGLAAHLLSPTRTRVAVVVTPASGKRYWFDAETIATESGDRLDVYRLDGGATGWAFTNGLPHGFDVYGGAARIYPPGPPEHRSRDLFLAYDSEQAVARQPALIDSAVDASYRATPPVSEPVPAPATPSRAAVSAHGPIPTPGDLAAGRQPAAAPAAAGAPAANDSATAQLTSIRRQLENTLRALEQLEAQLDMTAVAASVSD